MVHQVISSILSYVAFFFSYQTLSVYTQIVIVMEPCKSPFNDLDEKNLCTESCGLLIVDISLNFAQATATISFSTVISFSVTQQKLSQKSC